MQLTTLTPEHIPAINMAALAQGTASGVWVEEAEHETTQSRQEQTAKSSANH